MKSEKSKTTSTVKADEQVKGMPSIETGASERGAGKEREDKKFTV